MPRGGKRHGAGRPFGSDVLDEIEKIIVGAEYAKRRNSLYRSARQKAEDAVRKKSGYDTQIEEVKSQPDWRHDYVPSGYDEDGEPIFRTMAGEYHHEDVAGAIEAMTGADITPIRPYGFAKALSEEVANWASAKLGKRVTPRMVNSCWRLARSL